MPAVILPVKGPSGGGTTGDCCPRTSITEIRAVAKITARICMTREIIRMKEPVSGPGTKSPGPGKPFQFTDHSAKPLKLVRENRKEFPLKRM
jgi:hypothetical protein